MSLIRIPVEAYILGLFPQSPEAREGTGRTPPRGQSLQALESRLAVPSFWHVSEINEAFDQANEIWRREAEIEFTPINISERVETVPADADGMWIHFLNHLTPRTRGIGVGFVHDIPGDEGGWGGGRVAIISSVKAHSGLAGFPGSLLAHELGHVLIDDPLHELAGGNASNLMFENRNPRVANAGLLNERQVEKARGRAADIM